MTVSRAQPAPLRSFKRRTSRVTLGQADALERLWSTYGLAVDGRLLDLPTVFGRNAAVVLEIGFGMGEATAELAAREPHQDVLAADVHLPGQGALLRELGERELTNVRVLDGDAIDVLRDMLAPSSLDGVRLFFPDPWPKRRHWKRRLVTTEFLDLVATRLVAGGRLHLATDWPPYASQVRERLEPHPAYDVVAAVPWRPQTRFERLGLAAGRPSTDIIAVRRATGAA